MDDLGGLRRREEGAEKEQERGIVRNCREGRLRAALGQSGCCARRA